MEESSVSILNIESRYQSNFVPISERIGQMEGLRQLGPSGVSNKRPNIKDAGGEGRGVSELTDTLGVI